MTIPGLRIVFAFYSFAAVQIVTSAFFQSIGKAYASILLSLSRQVLFLIPLILILPEFFDIEGVWASMPAADLLSFVICALMLRREIKKLKAGASAGTGFSS
jgi:Na+-driven multidrug efflux pump